MESEFDKIKINCFTILIIQGIQAFFYELYTSDKQYVNSKEQECSQVLKWSFATLIALTISIIFCGLNIIAAYFQKGSFVKYLSMLVGFSQLAIVITYIGDWICLNSECGKLYQLNKLFFIIMLTVIGISIIVSIAKFLNSKVR